MALCEICDLDDAWCAHSARGRRATAPSARPRRLTPRRKIDWDEKTTGTNRLWQGERLTAIDFLRRPEHKKDARHQIDIVWHCRACMCEPCVNNFYQWFTEPPPGSQRTWEALTLYSGLALSEAMHVLDNDFPDWHERHPRLEDWLAVLRERHQQALERQADLDGIEMAQADRSRSARPPARWMGRSPGYYSRGR